MKVLVVNAGSSSLKFTVFNMDAKTVLAKGLVERIGMAGTKIKYQNLVKGIKTEEEIGTADHSGSLKIVCQKIADPQVGVVSDLKEINAIGHRIVHGGEKFSSSVKIIKEVKETIKEMFPLAPLHNPANLDGVNACESVFPGVPNVGVFDTAFHATMPKESYLYPIPYELYTKYGIRRYGFHGTSHNYVYNKACELLKLDPTSAKVITCHLGNGSSIAAVHGGKVFDTSMGLTPLDGLAMGTRCGSIDPTIIFFLAKQGMKLDDIDTMLNKKSGMYGLGGIHSGDMRDMVEAATSGNEQAQTTLEIVKHRVIATIGSYFVELQGVDAIIFTGGIGENCLEFRDMVLPYLTCIGATVDLSLNTQRGVFSMLSKPESKIKVAVIPTDEELMIAQETVRIVSGK